jgi:hypothetical protein
VYVSLYLLLLLSTTCTCDKWCSLISKIRRLIISGPHPRRINPVPTLTFLGQRISTHPHPTHEATGGYSALRGALEICGRSYAKRSRRQGTREANRGIKLKLRWLDQVEVRQEAGGGVDECYQVGEVVKLRYG